MQAGIQPGPVLLQLRQISKAFPGVQALDGVSLELACGEIHGLVGENGAGKSTLIKVLAGVYALDSGAVRLDGKDLPVLTPALVHALGVRFIHQELHLVPHFTVAESVYMGQEVQRRWGLDRKSMRARAQKFFHEVLDARINPDALVRDLGIAERKLVQIARALIDGAARVVVFDEPTAPLPGGESEHVFAAIRSLRDKGVAILYVSHYIEEITRLCDRVTVFRNGRDVARFDSVNAASADAIVHQMIGREIGNLFPPHRAVAGATLLEVNGLADGAHFSEIDLHVARGEIVGIAGLLGSGREEFTDTLFGLRRPTQGTVRLDGKLMRLHSPADAVGHGIALVPRDRRHDGVVLDMPLVDNINLASLQACTTLGLENRRAANARAAQQTEALDIRPRSLQTPARLLSGGNQQKVVLARWLASGPRLFLLDEPTLGVDVGAREEIYALVAGLAGSGVGVIVSSSDLSELLGICSRIVVLFRGSVVGEYAAAELDIASLMALTTGSAQVATA